MTQPSLLHCPALFYPFAIPPARKTDDLEEDLVNWVQGFGVFAMVDERQGTRITDLAGFSASACPEADLLGQRVFARTLALVAALDDVLLENGPLSDHLPVLTAFTTALHAVLLDPYHEPDTLLLSVVSEVLEPSQGEYCKTVVAMTRSLAVFIDHEASPTSRARLTAGFLHFLTGVLWEVGWHDRAGLPGLHEYAINRRLTTGVTMFSSLLDIGHPRSISEATYHRPDIRRLVDFNGDLCGLCDDIASYGEERQADSSQEKKKMNAVRILMARKGIGEQEALNEVAHIHNRRGYDYHLLEQQVLKDSSPEVLQFVHTLRCLTRGFYEWALTCQRYRMSDYYDPRSIHATAAYTPPDIPFPLR